MTASANEPTPGQGEEPCKPTCPPADAVAWPQVKEILRRALAAWQSKNGKRPDLRVVHGQGFIGDHDFLGWETKEELQQAVATIKDDPTPYRLIEPGKPAQQTNLILALTKGVPIEEGVNYPQMPNGGPYLTPDEVAAIAKWIDGGMPG